MTSRVQVLTMLLAITPASLFRLKTCVDSKWPMDCSLPPEQLETIHLWRLPFREASGVIWDGYGHLVVIFLARNLCKPSLEHCGLHRTGTRSALSAPLFNSKESSFKVKLQQEYVRLINQWIQNSIALFYWEHGRVKISKFLKDYWCSQCLSFSIYWVQHVGTRSGHHHGIYNLGCI